MEIKRSSGKGPADYFTGTVRVDPLFSAPVPARAVGASVRLEPGAHSDLHQVRNEWKDVMATVYPCVPGHEVTKFKPGDIAAVGCLVDSDRTCAECQAGLEQFCPNLTLTYNSPDKHLGGATFGGYSDSVVVDERFVLRILA